MWSTSKYQENAVDAAKSRYVEDPDFGISDFEDAVDEALSDGFDLSDWCDRWGFNSLSVGVGDDEPIFGGCRMYR